MAMCEFTDTSCGNSISAVKFLYDGSPKCMNPKKMIHNAVHSIICGHKSVPSKTTADKTSFGYLECWHSQSPPMYSPEAEATKKIIYENPSPKCH